MKKTLLLSVVASTMIIAGGDIEAVEVPIVEDFLIFSNIQGHGEIRPRYEGVDTDNAVRDANAFTIRAQLSIQADLFQVEGLSTYLEATGVYGDGHYFDTTWGATNPDNGLYNLVADPDQSRFTQAYIDYKFSDTLIRAGRQGINLDNQRFVGTVDWRQMPQTFDAVAVINNSIEGLNLLAAYIWQVNTIKAKESGYPAARGDRFDTGSVVLHAAYTVMPELTFTGYGYLLEDIHDTWGIAATGKVGIGENSNVSYRAEYAIQNDPSFTDLAPNTTADADYLNLEATLNMSGFLLGAGYELLSGVNNVGDSAFTTPLSTLHAHNGWADVFLPGAGNLATGLVDANAMIGYKSAGFGVAKVLYHDFSSDVGSIDYGTEIDVLYKNKIPGVKGLSGLIKGAWYSADDYKVDKTVLWAMIDYKF